MDGCLIFRVSTHVGELEKYTPLTQVSSMPNVLNNFFILKEKLFSEIKKISSQHNNERFSKLARNSLAGHCQTPD